MSLLPSSPLIDQVLRTVARRYRLPPFADAPDQTPNASPSTALAIAIEQARRAVARGEVPPESVKRLFVEALARLIHEARRAQSGDPVFQAMVLRHRAAQVQEYASLSVHADQDRRSIHATVNAIAHPGKQQRILPGPQRDALTQLHAYASSSSWSELHDAARRLLRMPEIANESSVGRGLSRLLDSPALERLQRLDALASDDLVRQYRSLWDRHGPRPGSSSAVAQGAASQKRGAAVEALAAQALEALARRLNETAGGRASYRVVTSMRAPPSLPASSERAKTEWDVVLLGRANADDEAAVWDVCLLVEAKASVDAATTDLSRLLRGLRLLAHADEDIAYSFETRQGKVRLRGASLRALTTDEAGLTKAVLYCCDAPAETSPRLLGAASRMQLLSAQASLEFASALADGQHADPQNLEPVWHQLLASPRWRAVLHQYPMLRQVRDLMVHTEDLLAAIDGVAEDS
ncbi:3-deoxy-D-arabino-heptulosonate 7-phosphate synthase [Paraburkholderia phymatum]|uniref:3-deoxy-D-arabino-heptulosonate 7-phosphate synthase n=1 Tax=Paraburkholderia phymatum TaxID=148447 RepID=UPI00316D3013